MNIQIHESYPPIAIAQIKSLEQRLGMQLPQNYINFLLSHNGGFPEIGGFVYRSEVGNRLGVVNRFLGIHSGKYDNLDDYLMLYKEREKRIPSNLIPIANDPGGNLICLSIDGIDLGNVYFWDHDWESEDEAEVNYSNVYCIANSLEEFFQNLRKFD
ncbi:SMI1/KNR4 family protein [Microcoleus anatoxicus]|uniref:SMI1/KNR4 family protein n=1 Tax=Microcoleus anatoxicus PTRS2 TaxID=2705321 RepID=A0ABU8YV30_9CYAN|nr:MAG: SMI1/KNR4 family protein [Oscillatoriales cyanobacterium]